ncbi:META domain-containing protein [Aeromicrobium phragmitis]|uniref:META domain-containing protein n=1 Tax=Aeromicrobium phragmitis TaxID=2478914 RepID=UPI00140816E7|nr:META domain-containing protein [Aeromicrobium phragmitis]
MRSIAKIALVAAMVAMAGCGTDDASSPSSDVSGTWGTEAARSPFLVLDDGEFRGSDGCNRLHGTYEVDGDVVRFSSQLHTMMACPGVDSWLSRLATAEVDGDALVIFDHEEQRIGTLPRSG